MTATTRRGRPGPRIHPTNALPPRPRGRSASAAVVSIAAAALVIAISILIERLPFGITAGVVIIAGGVFTVIVSIRDRRRGELLDAATESILQTLGARTPSRSLVRARRWSQWWVGVPTRITVKYSATVDGGDPRFLEAVLSNVGRRVGADYRVRRQLPKRCELELELDRAVLEERSPEIVRAEKVARELLGASATVSCDVDAAGAVIAINAKYDTSPRLSLGAYRYRIEKALSSMLPGRWRSQWDTERDRVRFEIRPAMPSYIEHRPVGPIPELTHASYDSCKIPFCVDEDGNVISWQPSVMPHLLIIGGTGSGKTAAEHTILTACARLGWRTWVLDGKRIEFAGYKDWPNVELVASKVGDQVRLIHAAHDLMEERYSRIESGQAKASDFDPLLIVIDEYATFQARVVRWYKTVKIKGDPTQPPVFELVADMARLARSAKIHMVVGIQRPDVTFLGGEMRDNFGARLSLGRLSPQGAMMMWDSAAVGVAIPRNQRGRGVALDDDSNPVEVQTFYTPDPAKADRPEQLELLERLRPPEISYPRKMIRAPRPDYEGLEVGREEPSYSEWARARIVAYDPDEAGEVGADVIAAPRTADAIELAELRAAAEVEHRSASDPFAGYEEPALIRLTEVVAGDLLLVDESLELWGVVEQCEVDLLEDGYMSIDYRDLETGEPNTVSIPDSDRTLVRRPLADAE